MSGFEIDDWHGLYSDGWQGQIVPAAFAHPAKFSRALIRHIYEHCSAEGWLAAGVELAAAACAERAERHGLVADMLLPDTAAREFIVLRGEAAACERAIRAVLAPAAAGGVTP